MSHMSSCRLASCGVSNGPRLACQTRSRRARSAWASSLSALTWLRVSCSGWTRGGVSANSRKSSLRDCDRLERSGSPPVPVIAWALTRPPVRRRRSRRPRAVRSPRPRASPSLRRRHRPSPASRRSRYTPSAAGRTHVFQCLPGRRRRGVGGVIGNVEGLLLAGQAQYHAAFCRCSGQAELPPFQQVRDRDPVVGVAVLGGGKLAGEGQRVLRQRHLQRRGVLPGQGVPVAFVIAEVDPGHVVWIDLERPLVLLRDPPYGLVLSPYSFRIRPE